MERVHRLLVAPFRDAGGVAAKEHGWHGPLPIGFRPGIGRGSDQSVLKAVRKGARFIAEHPGVPRMMFGELQRTGDSLPRRMVRTLLARYSERLQQLFAEGKAEGEIDPTLDAEAAATLFIGTIQGLVMQSMLSGDVERICRDAPRVFAIYQRGIRSAP